MGALSLALALLAATPGLPNPRGYVYSQPSLMAQPEFEFNTSGMPTVSPLCSVLQTDDKTAPWGCLDTDGNNAGQLPDAGSFTWTHIDAGNPITRSSEPLCPNGPDCASVVQDAWNVSNTSATSSSAYETPAMPDLGSAFTICALVSLVADPNGSFGYQNIISRAAGGGTIDVLWQTAPGSVGFTVNINNAVGYTVPAANITEGAWHLLCDVVSARGGSNGRFYIDGTDISGAHSTPVASAFGNQPFRISGYNTSGNYPLSAGSRFRGAFFTSEALSAARIAAIARAVLADTPTGSKGEAITFARNSPVFCPSSNGKGSILPPGRPCVARDSILDEGEHTNSSLRGKQLDNAVWTVISTGGAVAPTVTANAAKAPDGSWTADRVQVNACPVATQASVVFQDYTGTAAAWTGSFWVKGNGASGSMLIYFFDSTAGAGTGATCSFTSSDWTPCQVTRTFANTTHRFGFGCVNDAIISGSSNTGAVDVFVWGGQVQPGSHATQFIPTYSAAVTKVRDDTYFTIPAITTGTYCAFANFSTNYNISSTNARLVTLYQSGGVWTDDYFPTNYTAFLYDGVASSLTSATAVTTSGRVGSYYDLANLGVCVNATCTSTAAARTINNITRVRLGGDGAGGTVGSPDAFISRVQVGSSRARCTP